VYDGGVYNFQNTGMASETTSWAPQPVLGSNSTLVWNGEIPGSVLAMSAPTHQTTSRKFDFGQVGEGGQNLIGAFGYNGGEAYRWPVASNVAGYASNGTVHGYKTDHSPPQSGILDTFSYANFAHGLPSPIATWNGSDTNSYAAVERSPSYNGLPSINPESGSFRSQSVIYAGSAGLLTGGFDALTPIPSTEKGISYNQPTLRQESSRATDNWVYASYFDNRSLGVNGLGTSECMIDSNVPIPSPSSTTSSESAAKQREWEDKILLGRKALGWTYKQIKEEIRNPKIAESTLRGRYRSLTKDRKDRVRKPVWTPHDVGSSSANVPLLSHKLTFARRGCWQKLCATKLLS
jgi:hypothetical protein